MPAEAYFALFVQERRRKDTYLRNVLSRPPIEREVDLALLRKSFQEIGKGKRLVSAHAI